MEFTAESENLNPSRLVPNYPKERLKVIEGPGTTALVRVVAPILADNFVPYSKNFQQNPVVEIQDNGKDFLLHKPVDFYFWVYVDTNMRKEVTVRRKDPDSYGPNVVENYIHIHIGQGFSTDFVSSPPLLWSIIGPLGKAAKPSVLHDFFYRNAIDLPMFYKQEFYGTIEDREVSVSRKIADDVFYLSLGLRKVGKVKSKLMYWALRLFGQHSYNQ